MSRQPEPKESGTAVPVIRCFSKHSLPRGSVRIRELDYGLVLERTQDRANLRQGQHLTGDKFFTGETFSKIIEDDAIGQKIFLLVFFSDFDRSSHCFCATVDLMPK